MPIRIALFDEKVKCSISKLGSAKMPKKRRIFAINCLKNNGLDRSQKKGSAIPKLLKINLKKNPVFFQASCWLTMMDWML